MLFLLYPHQILQRIQYAFQSHYVLILTVTAHIVKPDTVIIGQSEGNLICQAFQHYSSLSAIKHFCETRF